MWRPGRDEYAVPVVVRLANVPGMVVAGLPGSGKTSLISRFVCELAPSPAVQFAVVDGKGEVLDGSVRGDYEGMASRFYAFTGDDMAQANAIFRQVYELRRRRAAVIRSALGVKNMWHVGPSMGWPLVVLIVDEAHTFLSDVNLKAAGDRAKAALVMENRALVEDVVKKGRSVGIMALLATQKATGDAIPTAIRDVCPVRLSFAQANKEAAEAALGTEIREYPEANPVSLQDSAYVGVGSMVVEGRPGFTRVRTPYVAEEDAERVCSESARLTRDPMSLLLGGVVGRPALVPVDLDAAAAARGEDRSAAASDANVDPVGSELGTERVTPSPVRPGDREVA